MPHFFTQKKQKGLTLLEILIAMVISIALIAGIATVYISSKNTYVTRDQRSIMDENARVALVALTRNLEHANYGKPDGDYFIRPNMLTNGTLIQGRCEDGESNVLQVSALRETKNDVNVYGDSIGIAFIADNDLFVDCANMGVSGRWLGCRRDKTNLSGSRVYNSFHVTLSQGVPALMCRTSRSTAATPVAEGIENLQLMYGVNIDRDRDNTVDRYLTAAEVDAQGLWLRVLSIKVAILVRSIENTLPIPESKTYTLLDKTVTSPSDKHLRAVYTTVVHLRNAIDG